MPESRPESSLLTRCPNCQTQFRVTDQQLGIANGKVRCGNCMKIFNAVEHQTAPPASSASDGQSAAAGFTATEDDLVFQDDPEEDATEHSYAGNKLTFSEDELSDSFRSFDEEGPSFDSEEADEEQSKVDESWAEAMLLEEPRKDAAKPAPEDVPAKPEPTRDAERNREPDARPEPSREPEPEQPPAPQPRPELALEPTDHEPLQASAPPAAESAALESFSAERERPSYKPASPYQDLGHDPISLDNGGRSWLRTTVWTLLVLGLLGLLGAQVGYYQFDRLAAIPELRPYYETACQYAGCELKPLVDVSQIKSRKLVVRTDPQQRDALVVDAEIINRAPFDQPFPAIALTFSNLNGDVVAQSVFPPEDYLAGDASDLTAMPNGVPVRIAIRIRDPGRDAVNYNIAFRRYAP